MHTIRTATRVEAECWEELPEFPGPLTAEETELYDTEPPNWVDRSSVRGMAVIREYAERCDRSEHFDTALVDLLADFRHACDALGLDFAEIDDKAHTTYLGDLNP